MNAGESFLRSSIGKKVVMALSGVVLFGFVVGHMLGNLQVYLGPAALNTYAESLRKLPALLWAARAGLLIAAVLHVWAAVSLSAMNRRARPVGYLEKGHRESTYASRTMRWTGVLVLAFIVYHLLHFTWGTVHPSFVAGDVYHNVVAGFRATAVSAFYIAAMLALGFHLYHGVWSMLHTLGLSHPRYDRLRYGAAAAITAIVVIANISFPVAVMTGLLRERAHPAPVHASR
jgi:succinate dehydrogenase / fumarate reductase cytochrome b subunit